LDNSGSCSLDSVYLVCSQKDGKERAWISDSAKHSATTEPDTTPSDATDEYSRNVIFASLYEQKLRSNIGRGFYLTFLIKVVQFNQLNEANKITGKE